MKKQFCILFCLFTLGCQEQRPAKPAYLLPESKMVSIMADIHTAEAQIESSIAYPDTALMVFGKLKSEILEKHNVTAQDFRKTFDYYTIHVPEMDKLYEIITDTLVAREARYVKKESQEKPDTLVAIQPDTIK